MGFAPGEWMSLANQCGEPWRTIAFPSNDCFSCSDHLLQFGLHEQNRIIVRQASDTVDAVRAMIRHRTYAILAGPAGADSRIKIANAIRMLLSASLIEPFVPARQAAELRVDFEVSTCLRAMFVMLAALGIQIEPHTRQHVEVLISRDTFADRLQPFVRNCQSRLLSRLERRHRCSQATRSAGITR